MFFAYGCVNVFIVLVGEIAIVIANLKISYSGHTFHSHATLVWGSCMVFQGVFSIEKED